MGKLNLKTSCVAFISGFAFSQLLVAIFLVLGTIVCTMLKIDTTEFKMFNNTGIGYMISVLIMQAGLFLTATYFTKKETFTSSSKFSFKKALIYAFCSANLIFMLSPIVTCFDSLLVKLGKEPSVIPYELNLKNYLISIFSLAILPAVCEELLFRNTIFKGLKKYGNTFEIIISTIMFAIFHMSVNQLIYPILMGLFFSCVMAKENNILYTIICHAVNNFLSLTLSFFNISLMFKHWTFILLAILLFVIYLATMIFFIKKLHNKSETKPSKDEIKILIITMSVMIVLWIIILLAG